MIGDRIHEALAYVGITPDLVSKWIGDCCCEERKEKINALHLWTNRILSGKIDNAAKYLKQLMS